MYTWSLCCIWICAAETNKHTHTCYSHDIGLQYILCIAWVESTSENSLSRGFIRVRNWGHVQFLLEIQMWHERKAAQWVKSVTYVKIWHLLCICFAYFRCFWHLFLQKLSFVIDEFCSLTAKDTNRKRPLERVVINCEVCLKNNSL